MAVPLVRQTLRRGQPDHLHTLFDAGAGKADAGVRVLWDLVDENDPRLDVTIRAVRYPQRMKEGKALPAEQFKVYHEAGRYTGAQDKEIRLAETTTVLKGESAEQAVRTSICREIVPGPKKDRWHPLYTRAEPEIEPVDVLSQLGDRQHHEQAYRVGVHDEFLEAVPPGYNKDSNPNRPGFQRGGMQLVGWLVALVYNALAEMAGLLAGDLAGSHVRTLRRMFINRPGTLYQTPEALIVCFDPFAGQEALIPVIDQFNAQEHRLPWLANRLVILCLSPRAPSHPGP